MREDRRGGLHRLLAAAIAATATACAGGAEPVQEPPPPTPPAATPTPTPEAAATPPAPSAAPSAVASSASSATPAASAAPSAQGKCGPGMVELTGGTFKSSYFKKDMTTGPFCLDANEVTTDQYTACTTAGKCDKNLLTICDPSTFGVAGRGNMPMVCVDFGQAETYCKAQGKRLPSDIEWEWAARAGSEGRLYPWGNDAPGEQVCWSGTTKRDTPCPVGSFPAGATPQGIFDLSGNVYEWTTTTNDASSTFRVGRGGSWKDAVADVFKNTRTGGFKNTYRCGFLGIRCATAVP